jgi:hypothetical protein
VYLGLDFDIRFRIRGLFSFMEAILVFLIQLRELGVFL